MEDVPKTVLKRLREAAPVEGHPDADLLTAFAEQSLAELERREVLQHLARCGNCREVVSLALPASEAVILPDSLVARSGWLSWPVLRWGVAAAGIILVASVGLIQYQGRHPDQAVVAKSTVPQLNGAFQGSLSSSPAASSLSVAAPDSSAKKMELWKAAPANAQPASSMKRRSTPSSATQQPMSPSDAAGAISTYGSGNGFGISSPNAPKGNPSPGPIEKPDLPGTSEMVEVQTETAQAAPAISDVTHERLAKDSKGQQTQAGELTDLHAVGKAKNPVPAQDQSASAPAPTFAPATVPLQTFPALMRWTSPRWTITPAGGLQRSFDDGQTWEDVSILAESLGHRSEIGSEIRKTASQKAVTEYKNRKSTDENADKALPSSNLIFRAVAAIGSEVWAGGLNTILYHSVDSGAGWIKVLPSQTGAMLTGDITSIDFSDLQHGRVLTSTSEVWLTVNDGETWEKQ